MAAARHERVRRISAALVVVAGAANLASSAMPPIGRGLRLVLRIVPLFVPQTADALVALAALVLLAVARGVRRGQRQAWLVAIVLLAGTALLHVVKGVELVESGLCLATVPWLVAMRTSFTTAVDRPSRRLAAHALLIGTLATTFLSTATVELSLVVDPDLSPLPPLRALEAVTERLVGLQTIPLPPRLDEFLAPSLLAVGLTLATFALALVSRPVVDRRRHAGSSSHKRARDLVRRHGTGTLDYFALRHDKQHFFDGETLVTYAVYGGVCLVSPDPIGPEDERARAWARFRRFADARGWTVAVLGASEDRLPTYQAAGMHELYVGDEAIVDVTSFDLHGGRSKGLRQAVNRIARNGYTVSFHDPRACAPGIADALRSVMTKSRRGGKERGFSMTLGRLFDPEDDALLIAVAHGPDGVPVAFCQYVPAPGIDGYSLDLMRRDDGEHPNGLVDFVIVSTIEHLREHGMTGLGLNFATMRAVLAGEGEDCPSQRLTRWLLKRMSGSMQIESLWRFNAKYHPRWFARYVVYGAPEHLPSVAVAIARAESFWELPLIGRFLAGGRERALSRSERGTASHRPPSHLDRPTVGAGPP